MYRYSTFIFLCLLSIAAIGQQHEDPQATEYARKASELYNASELDSSLLYYKKARSIYLEKNDEENYLGACNNILDVYFALSDLESARNLMDSLRVYIEEVEDKFPSHSGVFWSLYAVYYERVSNRSEAIASAERAIRLMKSAQLVDKSNLAIVYFDLGLLYQRNGDYLSAKHFYQSGLDIKLSINSTGLSLGNAYNSMAVADYFLGNYEDAIRYYQKALDAYLTELNEIHPRIAIAYNNLAHSYMNVNRPDKAMGYHRRALVIRLETLPENHPQIISSYNGIASVHFAKEEFDEAEKLFATALDLLMSLENNGQYDRAISGILLNLVRLNNQRAKYDKAIEYAQRGVNFHLSGEEIDSLDFNKVTSLPNLINFLKIKLSAQTELVEEDKSKISEALKTLEEVDKISNYYLNDLQFIDSQLPVLESMNEVYELGVTLTYNQINQTKDKTYDQLFRYVESYKSNLLRRRLQKNENLKVSRLDSTLLKKEKELRSQIASLRTNQEDSLKNELFELERNYLLLINNIERRDPNYYKYKFSNSVASLDQLTAYLNQENKVALEYFLTDDNLYAIGISATNILVKKLPIDSSFQDQIITFKNLAGSYTSDSWPSDNMFVKLGSELYNKLVSPFESMLTPDKGVVVIPDRALNLLPFELLLTSTEGNYSEHEKLPFLFEKTVISYANSASLLIGNKANAKGMGENTVLAFAPEYLADDKPENDQYITRLRNNLTPLPWAQKEVSGIAKHFNTVSFTKDQATEKLFKENVSEYNIIHVAGHGLINDENPMLSGLSYYQVENDSLQDGYIFTQELFGMDIPADLVVLSACNTGFGQIVNGEGVFSMAHGFFYAGAKSVVMSLWPVDDESTAIIMDYFYRNLSEGMKKSEALRQAKLSYIQNADVNKQQPFFWGAFVVIGDDSPIVQKSNSVLHILSVLLISIVFAGVLLIRERV